jgi:16S rRNA (adenine(1408)-N(1))-methyltransferase
VTIDLGTGDGRAVLRAARAEPERLAIGVDADAASMRACARRAERRGALPNAVFVVAAVESLPDDLDAVADRISVTFPWGSLLRGLTEPSGPILEAIRRVSAHGASIDVVWSVTSRDGVSGLDDPSTIAKGFRDSGFHIHELRLATPEEIQGTHSSWAKRLGAGRDRPAHILRAGAPGSPDGRRA